MTRLTPRQALDLLRLINRRAKGLEPGDDALSRLRLDAFPTAPLQWLKATAAKLATVFILAALAACLFAGGIALLRAIGIEH